MKMKTEVYLCVHVLCALAYAVCVEGVKVGKKETKTKLFSPRE